VLRARRYGRGLSLVFFDIDDFSEFNATYGHTLGDRLLRALAMTLAGSVAPPEMVARYGGDQFALLLPESNSAQAVQLTCSIIQRLRRFPSSKPIHERAAFRRQSPLFVQKTEALYELLAARRGPGAGESGASCRARASASANGRPATPLGRAPAHCLTTPLPVAYLSCRPPVCRFASLRQTRGRHA
jgi:hypothetical protein